MTDKEKIEVAALFAEAMKPLVAELKDIKSCIDKRPPQASSEERKYLDERGWLESFGGEHSTGYAWIDMRPPPGQIKKTGEVIDPKTGQLLREVKQFHGGAPVGVSYTLAEALVMERKRNRGPLPAIMVEELTGNPPKRNPDIADKDQLGAWPINLQQWWVRDRQRRKLAGPFKTEQEARAWRPEAANRSTVTPRTVEDELQTLATAKVE